MTHFDQDLALMLQYEEEEDTKYIEPPTHIFSKMLDSDECMAMFVYLKENIIWGEGIQTRSGGHTRLAAMGNDDSNIRLFLAKIKTTLPTGKYHLAGIYLNYQRNGEEYTPTHSHQGGFQQVICLGPAKRRFVIGNKNYMVGNGDVIVFGSSKHGLPKDLKCVEERISIATFYLAI